MPDLNGGTRLADRYTLERRLGRSRGTETWLAADRVSGSRVALKILNGVDLSRDVLHREWQISIRLMHAHIVRVFEFHDEGEHSFYSMQFIDGPGIGVLAGAPLPELVPPLVFIADALRYAHAKDIVHRDLKAGNVLLDRNGAPYLIDFGVAASGQDRIGGGSLIAASPQLLEGREPEPADDIFAFGVLLYELISGQPPWSSSSTAEDIRHRVPPPPTQPGGEAVPDALASLVLTMLDKDPARRPDAESLVEALEAQGYARRGAPRRYVQSSAASAADLFETAEAVQRTAAARRPLPSRDATGRASGIRPRTLAIGLSVLLALLAGVVFLLPGRMPTEREVPAAATEAPEAEPADEAAGEAPSPALPERDVRVRDRAATEAILGELLSMMETLEARAVQRWGGPRFKRAQEAYAAGDAAYLARDYALAQDKYREAIDIVSPLLEEVDGVFERTLADAQAALENGDALEAVRLFELAVAITPASAAAASGLERAQNLDEVLSLTDQALAFERELELAAARETFERAVAIDPAWKPAADGLTRVRETMLQMQFDQRMSEGLAAIADSDYLAARAAFRRAQELKPESKEPADGLLQVEQALRLDRIRTLEQEAGALVASEQWQDAEEAFESILEIDDSLAFAQKGLADAKRMSSLHDQLAEYIAEPDSLSAPATMQKATALVVEITRMSDIGPRLADQRDELSRLLKRAATPLTVQLVSDNMTDVSIYKVGRLGSFEQRQLDLRPGTYVAVGSRPGFRDVRLEFRVAPEIDMQPVVVRCEERI